MMATRIFIFETTLRVGLFARVEAQVSVEPATDESSSDEFTEGTAQRRGLGDSIARLKANWWGDDGGATAFASIVYVHIPTNHRLRSARPGFGVLAPLTVSIESICDIESLIGMDAVDDQRYHLAWIASTVVSRELSGRLSTYLELFARGTSDETAVTIGTGGVWVLAHDLAIDLGLDRGLTRAAEDWGGTTGVTRRW